MDAEKKYLSEKWVRMGIRPEIIDAFLKVPREKFIPQELLKEAYADYPLPIGEGQTISQPTTVVLMLNWLDPQSSHNVLEIGTGSGYNAALLSHLARKVISVERIPELAIRAKRKLAELGLHNVKVIVGDGKKGYDPLAPYDRIIVTAAAEEGVPKALEEQLAENGRIVVPVGIGSQRMMLGVKKNATLSYSDAGSFVFVPLI